MRNLISSIFNSLDRGERSEYIRQYNTAILYGRVDDIYLDAQKLIICFPQDEIAIEAYFDGVWALENRIGAEDNRFIAMEIAAMPLQPDFRGIGPAYKEAAIRALTDICPRLAADNKYNIVEALAYLDVASTPYHEFPDLCHDAMNTSIDLINHHGAASPEGAANIASIFFPQEKYMFREEIARRMQAPLMENLFPVFVL